MIQSERLVLGALETNCYVAWTPGGRGIVIDPADEPARILALVRERGVTVTAVVLTHAHFDHLLGAEVVCRATGAPLYVGAADALSLTDPARNLSGLFSPACPVTLPGARPLAEAETVALGEESLTVLETPGHSPGSLCLYVPGMLFSGDTLFRGSVGRLDLPGGDAAAMTASLERLKALPEDTRVYPGHGPATTLGWEIRQNPYLR